LGGSLRPKHFKKCIKLNWDFKRRGGEGVLRENPCLGEGLDIFWNYTLDILNEYCVECTSARP